MPIHIDIATLPQLAGAELGPGPWHTISQREIDLFAEATGDDQWIHTDPARAATGPFGSTIAHGYFTLAMLPALQRELWVLTGLRMGINYGLDKVRFTSPVSVGARVRLRVSVLEVEHRGDGAQLMRNKAFLEVEGSDRPACIAHTLGLMYPAVT